MENNRLSPQEIAKWLDLQPLSREGGMFRRTWQTAREVDGHPMGTAIYFMLGGRAYSHLHRLPTDEVYHFYMGDAVRLSLIAPDGTVTNITLGQDLAAGQVPQAVAPAGYWQGSRVVEGGQYALMGTTMCPGFDESDYEHADAEKLKAQFPGAADVIDSLTGETVYL
ncbi:cupin domain-containing protein [Clostridia bacterium OttesenSCG-928-O13]|nr:cupin domain-containing protein [Clostridia bacterium OttesenSCG-928-O13]